MKTQKVLIPVNGGNHESKSYFPLDMKNKVMVNRRSSARFDVTRQGCLLPVEGGITLKLSNASLNGFSAHVDQTIKVPFGTKLPARISIDSSRESELIVTAVWKDDEGNFGFRIEKSDQVWVAFIKSLEAGK